jgi:hypothetical protein
MPPLWGTPKIRTGSQMGNLGTEREGGQAMRRVAMRIAAALGALLALLVAGGAPYRA